MWSKNTRKIKIVRFSQTTNTSVTTTCIVVTRQSFVLACAGVRDRRPVGRFLPRRRRATRRRPLFAASKNAPRKHISSRATVGAVRVLQIATEEPRGMISLSLLSAEPSRHGRPAGPWIRSRVDVRGHTRADQGMPGVDAIII